MAAFAACPGSHLCLTQIAVVGYAGLIQPVALDCHCRRPFIREVRIVKDYSDYEDVAYCEYNIEFVDSNKGCVCTCMLGTAREHSWWQRCWHVQHSLVDGLFAP